MALAPSSFLSAPVFSMDKRSGSDRAHHSLHQPLQTRGRWMRPAPVPGSCPAPAVPRQRRSRPEAGTQQTGLAMAARNTRGQACQATRVTGKDWAPLGRAGRLEPKEPLPWLPSCLSPCRGSPPREQRRPSPPEILLASKLISGRQAEERHRASVPSWPVLQSRPVSRENHKLLSAPRPRPRLPGKGHLGPALCSLLGLRGTQARVPLL